MADKYILVKTPLTVDGNMPIFGEDGKRVYSESILRDQVGPQGARAILTKRNSTLPEAIRAIIEDYEGPLSVQASAEIPAPAVNKRQMQQPNIIYCKGCGSTKPTRPRPR